MMAAGREPPSVVWRGDWCPAPMSQAGVSQRDLPYPLEGGIGGRNVWPDASEKRTSCQRTAGRKPRHSWEGGVVDWAELEQQLAAPEHQRFLADLERQGAADLAELERMLASPEHQQYLADLERMLADVG